MLRVQGDVAAEKELIAGRDAAEAFNRTLDGLDDGGAIALELKAVPVLNDVDQKRPAEGGIGCSGGGGGGGEG